MSYLRCDCHAGAATARLTNAHAAPFVPGGTAGVASQRLASMSSAAAPFVPKSAAESPRGALCPVRSQRFRGPIAATSSTYFPTCPVWWHPSASQLRQGTCKGSLGGLGPRASSSALLQQAPARCLHACFLLPAAHAASRDARSARCHQGLGAAGDIPVLPPSATGKQTSVLRTCGSLTGTAASPPSRSRPPATPPTAATAAVAPSAATAAPATAARGGADLRLPDDDDLLGMTAHMPGDASGRGGFGGGSRGGGGGMDVGEMGGWWSGSSPLPAAGPVAAPEGGPVGSRRRQGRRCRRPGKPRCSQALPGDRK